MRSFFLDPLLNCSSFIMKYTQNVFLVTERKAYQNL